MWWEELDINRNLYPKAFPGWSSEEIIYWILEHERDKKIKEIKRIITKKDRYIVCKRQSWRCNICGCKLKWNKDSLYGEKVAHIDHIFPFSSRISYPNGAENINESSNLQALCSSCNLNKSAKEIQ
jgi:5-methylcytosine-specific restriction endonuclease McrA